MRNKMFAAGSLASILALGAHAQQQPGQRPNASMPGQTHGISTLDQKRPTTRDQSTIRSYVNLVSTPVVVRNAKGELVTDLSQKDFRVFDNGVQQTLAAFEMGGAPLALVIVVENSSRIEALLPALRRTGSLFTQTVLGEHGEAAVIGYSNDVMKLLDFTHDDAAIEKALINLERSGSGAYLYDVLSTAVQILRNLPPSRRRVIVTMAEALDTGSEKKTLTKWCGMHSSPTLRSTRSVSPRWPPRSRPLSSRHLPGRRRHREPTACRRYPGRRIRPQSTNFAAAT